MHHIARPVWIIASCVRCRVDPRVFCAFRGPRPATSDDCLALDSCDLPHAQPRRVYSTTSKYTPTSSAPPSSLPTRRAVGSARPTCTATLNPPPGALQPGARPPLGPSLVAPLPRACALPAAALCGRPRGLAGARVPPRGPPHVTIERAPRVPRHSLGADSGDPREVLGVRSPSPAASSHWCSPWPTSPSCASSSPSSASARTP